MLDRFIKRLFISYIISYILSVDGIVRFIEESMNSPLFKYVEDGSYCIILKNKKVSYFDEILWVRCLVFIFRFAY